MTVGGNGPCLEGVAAPLGDCPAAVLNLSGALPCAAATPDPWPCKPRSPPPLPPSPPALFGGRGLFLISLRVVVDEEGVRLGDCVSREPLEEGDAVPSLDSLFFLEDLLSLLPRESCQKARVSSFAMIIVRSWEWRGIRYKAQDTRRMPDLSYFRGLGWVWIKITYDSLAESLHVHMHWCS